MVGTTVLHYTITRAIGSGGMGVVYEAEDAKLGRRVALKFLPPELARDRPALERFQREARAASALNHPNICTVYAIEESNGEHFIAMELLDGDSLDKRIAHNPLGWDALLDIGVQVADALDAAHQRGIIHRDIKPANIFMTREGRAKVLDFGVAKMGGGRGDAKTALAGAQDVQLTGPGIAVGTIAYMSPEQARGDEIDARSDLFSLAAVLYEAATGRPAFSGKTSAVIFQQILGAMPDPPRSLNPALPDKLEDIIVKGLEKDRDLRYQTAAELRADLKRLKRDASAGKPISSGAVVAAPAGQRDGLFKATVFGILALGAAVVVATAYIVYGLGHSARPDPLVGAGARLEPTRLTTAGDVRGCGSISPDGKAVVYCDFAGNLFARQVATGSTVPLGRVSGSTTFTPDGNYIYVSTGGALFLIPTFGGEPKRILTDVDSAVGASPDGKRIAFVRQNPAKSRSALIVADALGGNERELAIESASDTWFDGAGVSWSHDGKLISAAKASSAGGYHMFPVVVDATTGKVERLGSKTWPGIGRTAWLPGNKLLFAAQQRAFGPVQFWIAQYPGGAATRITTDTRGFGNNSVSVTADGSTIATIPVDSVSNLWATNADASVPLEQWTSGLRRDGQLNIAPQSTGRVFYDSADGTDIGVWSLDSPGGRPQKLTRDEAGQPSIPGDGRFVVFVSLLDQRLRVSRMLPDGSDTRTLTSGDDDYKVLVSPDGKWIYYNRADDSLMRMPAEGGTGVRVGEVNTEFLDVSPDGRRLLAYASPDPSAKASHVILDAETGAVQVKLDLPGDQAKWGRHPDVLAFLRTEKGVENLWEQPIAGGTPRQLTKFTTGRTFNFAYSPDRKRLFLARGTRTGDMVLIRNFQ